AVRDALLALLGAGHAAVPVIETLDAVGLWERYLPWWPRVRSKPQRNSFHRFTVDRHLLEAVAEAAPLMREVGRPDLLLMGALLHDMGKGWPGDHTDVGVTLAPPEMRRLGFSDADAADVTALVRHHLLLAETATRRDLDDPATVLLVARSVGRREVLQLLRSLTEADSIATGPAMWSDWKRGLLDQLTWRVAAVLGGEDPPPGRVLSDEQRALLGSAEMQLVATPDGEVTVASPDQPGLLAAFAGVLTLHRQEIRGLEAYTEGTSALTIALTSPRFGSPPDWNAVRNDLRRSLAGTLDVADELAKRATAYPVSRSAELLAAAPKALWLDGVSDRASVVELRAPDAMGLLARVAFALTLSGLQVVNARCSTLGVEVVDAFYVTEADGSLVADRDRRATVAAALEAAARG
ncbi:MAG TPA: HD domain-containing protein, partial [Mycobacteriales bacterium]|nr:HD domain-containing protein [Mycobacteriales bacterium]